MAKILLATDDAELYTILSAEIEGEGHVCLWTVEGQEAYEIALNEQPDAVLLDVALDIFDGFECCTMLREDPDIPKELPILLLSDDSINPKLLERVHASGHFPKTHVAHELVGVLVDLLPPDSMPSHIGL